MSLGYKISNCISSATVGSLTDGHLDEQLSVSRSVTRDSNVLEISRTSNECTWRKRSPVIPPWNEEIYHYSFQRFKPSSFSSPLTELQSIRSGERIEEADIISHYLFHAFLSVKNFNGRKKREEAMLGFLLFFLISLEIEKFDRNPLENCTITCHVRILYIYIYRLSVCPTYRWQLLEARSSVSLLTYKFR